MKGGGCGCKGTKRDPFGGRDGGGEGMRESVVQ